MNTNKKIVLSTVALFGAITLAGCSGMPSSNALPQGDSKPAAEQVEVVEEPIEEVVEEIVEPEVGTLDNPHPVGYVAEIYEGDEDNDLFTLSVTIKDGNAGAAIAQANQFNEPATEGHHYVAVEYTLTGVSKEEPTNVSWALMDWSLSLDDATIIPEANSVVMPEDWKQTYDINDLYAGQTGSVVVLYQIPDSYEGTLYATAYGSYITL